MAFSVWTLDDVNSWMNSGYQWTGNTITYAFPTDVTPMGKDRGGFTAFTANQITQVKLAIMGWDDVMKQSFQQITVASTDDVYAADIEYARSTVVDGGIARYPDDGSTWINSDEAYALGDWGFETFIHETGHALGLEHSGDYKVDKYHAWYYEDCEAYSIMSYFGPGGRDDANTLQVDWEDETTGDTYLAPTPMMNDIYVIQNMYGADTTTRTGDTVYGFNSNLTGDAAKLYNFTLNTHPVLTLYDAGGNDTLDLSGWNTASKIDLNDGNFSNANRMTYNLAIARNTVIENAKGGGGADKLTGNEFNNKLWGNAGKDTMVGGTGNDSLDGGTGNDSMSGGAGNDSYYLRESGDVIVENASEGTDLVHAYVSTTLGANVENGRIYNTFNITGNSLSNTLYASSGNNVISGGTGTEADTVSYLYGVSGSTGVTITLGTSGAQATGGSGSDTLVNIEKLYGSNYADKLTGSGSGNTFYGMGGNDTLDGSAGNDWINGGVGTDSLIGGTGNDVFDFNAFADLGLGSTRDVIAGWNTGDKIDLTTIDWNTTTAGDQAFSYQGSAAFSAAGQVRYSAGVLQFNTDSDTSAEYELVITGSAPTSLTAGGSLLL